MIELSGVIRELRSELTKGIAEGESEALRFALGQVELELAVSVTKEGEGGGKVKFWVVELNGKGATAKGTTQIVKLVLQPKLVKEGVAIDGPALIAGPGVHGER